MIRTALIAALLGAVCLPAAAGPVAADGTRLAQAVRPLVSGERVRVKKLARDIDSAIQSMDEGGLAPFQDPATVEKWRRSIERFREALARYPQVDDEDVRAAAERLGKLEQLYAFALSESGRQIAALGDVQARLAALEARLREARAPQWLPAPFGEDEARAWVAAAAGAKRTAEAALAEIAEVGPQAHLPLNPGTVQSGAPYDRQDLDRLAAFARRTVAEVAEAVDQTLANLKAGYDAQDRELAYYRGLDPEKPQDRMNAFLREGAEAEIYAALDRHRAFALSVVAWQRAFGQDPTAASLARVREIGELRARYGQMRAAALGASRLPEPRSTDPARLAIAEALLAEPANGFGTHGPVVLTTEAIVAREKQVSRAEIRDVDVSLSGTITLSGTETTWHYAWEEFRFATPLREDSGEWYVWWITARKYSSGWERTPIGRWVAAEATRGDLIPEANFRD